jgi:hypothetical protein
MKKLKKGERERKWVIYTKSLGMERDAKGFFVEGP